MNQILILGSSACCVMFAAGIALAAQEPRDASISQTAQQLEGKLKQLSDNASSADVTAETVVIYEAEINAYLQSKVLQSEIDGLSDLNVTLRAGGMVSAAAEIDFSSFDENGRQGGLELFSYLSGQVPVRFNGSIFGQDGVGTVTVDAFTVAGLPLPPSVFRQLLRSYAATEAFSEGVDVLESFDLPYGIAELRVEHGRIEIVQ